MKLSKAIPAAMMAFCMTTCISAQGENVKTITIDISEEARTMVDQLGTELGNKYFQEELFETVMRPSYEGRDYALEMPENDSDGNPLQFETQVGDELYGENHVYTFTPDEYDVVVMYIHGGAYTHNITASHAETCDLLAGEMGAKFYVPMYSLAPQGTWEDGYALMEQVWTDVLAEGKTTIIMGDSAGGGFALGFTEELAETRKALPDKLVLLSPWLDVTMSNPDIPAYEEQDVSLAAYGLVECGKLWAGDLDTSDRRISPINYDQWEKIPETLLFVGTAEEFYPDVTALAQKLQDARNEVTLVQGNGLFHVFPVYTKLPEGPESRAIIRDFVNGNESDAESTGMTEDAVVHKDVEITSENGLTLRGYLEGPSKALDGEEACPLIILMHGLCDSGEFELIRKQADTYTAAGYAVLAMDFNGHGKSDGKFIDMTISKELQDAQAIINYAKELPFVSETTLIGHSQGGAVAAITAASHSADIDHLVLLAPGGMIADRFRAGSCFGTEFDPSDPPEKVKVFDDYVGRDYIVDAMSMDLYAMADGYEGRSVLLVAGGEDPLVSEDVVRKYQEIYEKPELGNTVAFETIEGAPHDFYEHENEVTELVLSQLEAK